MEKPRLLGDIHFPVICFTGSIHMRRVDVSELNSAETGAASWVKEKAINART